MNTRNIIVMGASSGGVEALRKIIGELPGDLPASVFVVLHIPQDSPSMLPEILSRAGRLEARHPMNGEGIAMGTIYVAPPDRHMLIAGGTIRLDKGPRENGHRPAVDPLFTSAAISFGPRVIGVILSGSGDDGAAGLHFVKDRGGLAVVQEPADSIFPNMPGAALLAVAVDACAPAAEIPRILVDMVRSPGPPAEPPLESDTPEEERWMVERAKEKEGTAHAPAPTILTCPDCGGVLFELPEKKPLHYRCHVGHVFSGDSLSSGQKAVLEEALWSAVRMFQERVFLSNRIIANAESKGLHAVAESFRERVRKSRVSAKLIEELLLEHGEGKEETGRAEEEAALD